MDRASRFLVWCLAIIVIVIGVVWFHGSTNSKASATVSSLFNSSSNNLNSASLTSNIQAILNKNTDLDTSVSITDLQSGKQYHWGETASYEAASIGKLVTATTYLHEVEQGNAGLDDDIDGSTARQQLTQLITVSDNTAWQDLDDNIGGDTMNAYAQSIGMTTYTQDNNIMSSDDIALLLSKLYGQKLLNASDTNFLLSLMKQANMREYIVAAIPGDVDVYHKVGYLDDRLHDAAIIKKGDRSYVLVIFSKTEDDSTYDFDRGASIFGDITKASLQAFFP